MAAPSPRELLRDVFDAGLRAVAPAAAIRNRLRVDGGELRLDDQAWPLEAFRNIYVLSIGKAGASMAAAVEEVLGDRIRDGVVVTKYGHGLPLRRIRVMEAGHPTPDANGERAARAILEIAREATAEDLVVCCLSGGGSALFTLPAEGLTLEDCREATEALLASGADIREMNALRKHLSAVKGGRLARAVHPARLITLILSDVVGDPLEVIASGPTAPDPTTYADCLAVLRRYCLTERVPPNCLRRLERGAEGGLPETPKPGDPVFENVTNTLVGSNRIAVEACRRRAEELGLRPVVLSTTVEGEARDVAGVHAAIAREIVTSGQPVPAPCLLLSGGETTVTLKGRGKGGRNQEFALAAAIAVEGLPNVTLLSAGTDGTDGPTDAAGAFADGRTCARARELGLDPTRHLDANDAYPFFDALGDLLITGPTRTNVMDVMMFLVG